MDNMQERYLGELILKSLTGNASDRQIEQLGEIVSNDPQAMYYYSEYISLYACLACPGSASNPSQDEEGSEVSMDSNVSLDGVDVTKDVLSDEKEDTVAGYQVSLDSNIMQAMQELAEFEATAPAVHIGKPIERPDEPPIIRPARSKQEISKFSVLTLAFSTAAMILLLFLARLVHEGPPLVASLGYTVDAVWGQSTEEKVMGEDLEAGAYYLEKGLAQILFYNGATVIPKIMDGKCRF